MTAPSEHIWGLVCGLAEPLRSKRTLFMLKAYFDDSHMNQRPVSVLAGWMLPAKKWALFSDEWKAGLDMKPKIRYFKWAEYRGRTGEFNGISDESREHKLNYLVTQIRDYKPLGVASAMPQDVYEKLFAHYEAKYIINPYYLSFFFIISMLVNYNATNGLNEKIDFIFDIQPGQMGRVIEAWEMFMEAAPQHIKEVMGIPNFHDDMNVIPLQAADMNAGWTHERAVARYNDLPDDGEPPPWGSKGDEARCISRYWTVEEMKNFATLPDKVKGLA